jgi:leader peptidase (prepilin peptidase)/N-methyltransferase
MASEVLVIGLVGILGLFLGVHLSRRILSHASDHPLAGGLPAGIVLAAANVTILLRHGMTLDALELLCFAVVLLACALTDLAESRIPNRLVALAFALRLAYLLLLVPCGRASAAQAVGLLASSAAAALFVGGALVVSSAAVTATSGGEGVGGGDVKLLAACAFLLGWPQALPAVLLASVFGVAWGLVRRTCRPGDAFPWAPSIALACWVAMLL